MRGSEPEQIRGPDARGEAGLAVERLVAADIVDVEGFVGVAVIPAAKLEILRNLFRHRRRNLAGVVIIAFRRGGAEPHVRPHDGLDPVAVADFGDTGDMVQENVKGGLLAVALAVFAGADAPGFVHADVEGAVRGLILYITVSHAVRIRIQSDAKFSRNIDPAVLVAFHVLLQPQPGGRLFDLGDAAVAGKYDEIGKTLREVFRRTYWDAQRGLFADTRERDIFSQHVNSLAVLAGIATGEEARRVMTRTLDDPSLIQATLYFKFYVHRAMAAAGLGDRLLEELQPWYDQLAAGLTTWAETPDPTRSDCHAWSASPNVELFRMMLGIESAAPGFRQVRIAPSLGGLKHVSGTIPHPTGEIAVDYRIDGRGRLTAKITLPAGVAGEFVWQGRTFALRAGKQTLKIEQV